MTSAWGPSQAASALQRLGQDVPVCGMGIQTPHSVKADPSPCGSSAEHWGWSLEIWGYSWHFPAVLQGLSASSVHILPFPFSFPFIFMQQYWPPIFQSTTNGVDADPLQIQPFIYKAFSLPRLNFPQIKANLNWLFVYRGKMNQKKAQEV